jgi:hypothetical protein
LIAGVYRSPIFPDQVSDQMLAVELSNDLDVLKHIRLALEVPKRARDRGAGPRLFELAPPFESAVSVNREFEQVIHE